jgi:glycine cleavage system H protein
MSPSRTWIQKGLLSVALVPVLIIVFALFVVASVAMRSLLIIAAVVGTLIAVVLYYASPAFRKWFQDVGEPKISYKGLRLGWDIAVHPTHSWTRTTRGGAIVGADDFVQATLGPVETVDLPQVGSRVQQGERLFCLRRGNRSVEVRAPITGTVLTRNEVLLRHPELVNEEPFTDGWAVRLKADTKEDRQDLLRGKEARSWYHHEIDRLMGTMAADELGITSLPDGGTLVSELYRQIDDNAWKRLTETFFSMDPQLQPNP